MQTFPVVGQGTKNLVATTQVTVLPSAVDPDACVLIPFPSPGFTPTADGLQGTAGATGSCQLILQDAFGNKPLTSDPSAVAVYLQPVDDSPLDESALDESSTASNISAALTQLSSGVMQAQFVSNVAGNYSLMAMLADPMGDFVPIDSLAVEILPGSVSLDRSAVSGLATRLTAGEASSFSMCFSDAYSNVLQVSEAVAVAWHCLQLQSLSDSSADWSTVAFEVSAAADSTASVSFVPKTAGRLLVVCRHQQQVLLDMASGQWPARSLHDCISSCI